MVDKRHLDVWIIQTNVVYRAVPYSVVTDWLQQGRLLGEDQLRYSGTEKWVKISTVPSLSAFLPREEPGRVNDQAEDFPFATHARVARYTQRILGVSIADPRLKAFDTLKYRIPEEHVRALARLRFGVRQSMEEDAG